MADRMIHRTHRGKPIDMEALRIKHAKTIAAGNMGVNAKGDKVKGGKVVQTVQQQAATHYQNVDTQVAKVSLKPKLKETESQSKPTEPADDEPKTVLKTRKDGSTYNETINTDGTIEVEEVSPPKKETPAKSRKKPSASV